MSITDIINYLKEEKQKEANAWRVYDNDIKAWRPLTKEEQEKYIK